jgi:chromosome segregation ATPase
MAGKNSRLHQINILRVAQMQREHQNTQAQLKDLEQQYKAAIKELETYKKHSESHQKKYQTLESKHKDTQKELHSLKLAFDGDYAFRFKEDKREAMAKARQAKSNSKRRQQDLRKSRVTKESSAASRNGR